MLIRPARSTDQAALADLYLRSRRAAFTWRNPEDFQLDDFTRDTEGELIHLAEYEDGTLLGFISLWEPENFIHHLFISPDHLRQGIGQALLTDLHQRLPGPFRLKCLTANLPALAFYRNLGWTEVDRGTTVDGDYLLLESETSVPSIDSKMSGYESKMSDIAYLFDVASEADRTKVANMVHASIKKDGARDRFFDDTGHELSLNEIHRRTQENPVAQRFVYNMWMTYAH